MKKLKILTGKFKNRNLLVPKSAKPITSRVKKTLFDIILNKNSEYNSLADIFSGGGTIGIEAISNNYNYVTFVEQSLESKKLLLKNLLNIGIKPNNKENNNCIVKIKITDYQKFLETEDYQYDLITVDPPFNISEKIEYQHFQKIMHKESTLIIRIPKWKYYHIEKKIKENFQLIKTKIIGINVLIFIKK